MSFENNTPNDVNKDAKSSLFVQKIYETDSEKRKDFWIGVVLFFVLNILLWLCRLAFSFGLVSFLPGLADGDFSDGIYTILLVMLTLLPWVINIGLMIYFAFTRSQIALGMLTGFGIALVLVILLGVVLLAACFVLLGSYN